MEISCCTHIFGRTDWPWLSYKLECSNVHRMTILTSSQYCEKCCGILALLPGPTNLFTTCSTEKLTYRLESFLGLSLYLVLFYGDNNTWKLRSSETIERLGTFITWMLSGGHEVDLGGGPIVSSVCPCSVNQVQTPNTLDNLTQPIFKPMLWSSYIHPTLITWWVIPGIHCSSASMYYCQPSIAPQ